MSRSVLLRAEEYLEDQQDRFKALAKSINQGPQPLILELYRKLTNGKIDRKVINQIACNAAAEGGRRVRTTNAIPCLIEVWYLLGMPAIKDGHIPYGTMRRYAAAIQYGLYKNWSYEKFEKKLEKHGVTKLAADYDEEKEEYRQDGKSDNDGTGAERRKRMRRRRRPHRGG